MRFKTQKGLFLILSAPRQVSLQARDQGGSVRVPPGSRTLHSARLSMPSQHGPSKAPQPLEGPEFGSLWSMPWFPHFYLRTQLCRTGKSSESPLGEEGWSLGPQG